MLRNFVLRLLVLCLVCLQGLAPLVHAHVPGGAEHSGMHMHSGWQSAQTEPAYFSHSWSQDSTLAVEMESGLESRAWNAPHVPVSNRLITLTNQSDKLSPATSAPRGPPETPLLPPALAPPMSY
jgi:hypothetical protein